MLSHVRFAYDLASMGQVQNIKQIFHELCMAPGQKISFQKSHVFSLAGAGKGCY